MDPFPDGKRALVGRRGSLSLVALALLSLSAASVGGCEVTPEKIERWKSTEKGPGKLRDALHSSSVAPALRAQALVALVEIGMLAEAQEELKDVPEAQRRDVAHGAVDALVAMAQGAGKGAAVESTTRKQREGKDALFVLRDGASPEDKAKIDDALVEWTCVDLTGRETAGSNSTEKILTAIGARAGGRLAAVIADDAQSEANRTEAAKLLGTLGDKAAREQAGAKLVERARRERPLEEATMQQLGLVGGDHAVAFLEQVAENAKQSSTVRAKALYALALQPDAAALPTALRLAADKRAGGAVRDAAFELAEKMGPPAVPGLAKFLDDKEDLVRWRAVEAALGAGHAAAITTVLEGLSTTRSYTKDDLVSFVVHQLTLLGPAALPTLRDELRSKSWVARLAAAEALAEMGKPEDVARLEALASDETRLKGFPAATLGAEAKALASTLRGRR